MKDQIPKSQVNDGTLNFFQDLSPHTAISTIQIVVASCLDSALRLKACEPRFGGNERPLRPLGYFDSDHGVLLAPLIILSLL